MLSQDNFILRTIKPVLLKYHFMAAFTTSRTRKLTCLHLTSFKKDVSEKFCHAEPISSGTLL